MPNEAKWIVVVALLMNVGVMLFLWFVVYVAGSKKRADFCADIMSKVTGRLMRTITLGKRKTMIRKQKISRYFEDIQENVATAKENKKYLYRPVLWGMTYSLFEIMTYWIVAISLGRFDLLPYIMIGEAIGSVFDGIVPYGLYELGMAGVMIALGVDFPTATAVTVMTRVITLLFTILSGAIPYYKAIEGKKDARTT